MAVVAGKGVMTMAVVGGNDDDNDDNNNDRGGSSDDDNDGNENGKIRESGCLVWSYSNYSMALFFVAV